MIRRIGIQRVILLAILCALNLFIASGYFFVVMPAEEEAQVTLNSVNAQISDISARLQTIKSDMAAFKGNYERYQALEKGGFFTNQDRFVAARALDDIREKANILGFSYNIEPVETLPNPDAVAANMDMIKSKIKIDNVVSVFDMNFYTFLGYLNTIFPQQALVESFEMKRSMPVTEENLKRLRQEKVGFISASVGVGWYTMVPKVAASDAVPGSTAPAGEFRGR